MEGRCAISRFLLLAFVAAMGCGGKSETKSDGGPHSNNLAGAAGRTKIVGATSTSIATADTAGHAGTLATVVTSAGNGGAAGSNAFAGSGVIDWSSAIATAGSGPIAIAGAGNSIISNAGAGNSLASASTTGTGGIADCATMGALRCNNDMRQRCETNGNWVNMAQQDQCGGATPVCTGNGICAAYRLVSGTIDTFGIDPARAAGQNYVLTEQTLRISARVCNEKYCVTGGIRP